VTLTFDLESGVPVTCDVGYTSVPIFVFLGLSVLDLGPMYATDRQIDRQPSDKSIAYANAPVYGRGHNNNVSCQVASVL